MPEKLVFDNDTSIVASRQGGVARLHLEVAALLGPLAVKPVVLKPATPTSKGQVETIRFLETSFVPLRTFAGLGDLRVQHDIWAAEVSQSPSPPPHRRGRGRLRRPPRRGLRPLPEPLPDVSRQLETRVGKDCFVRDGNVDYSVSRSLAGRRPAEGHPPVGGRAARGDRERREGWAYQPFLAAVLARGGHPTAALAGQARPVPTRSRPPGSPQVKTLDDFDLGFQRSIDRTVISHVSQLDFLHEAKNVVFLAPPGTGKTHLSIALGVQADATRHLVAFATGTNEINASPLPNAQGSSTSSSNGSDRPRC